MPMIRGSQHSGLKSLALGALVWFLVSTAWPNFVSASERRSHQVTREFQREHPCPSTGKASGACPGYRKDHVVPLACGGPDAVSNMQWQTVAAAKAKDGWERRACGRYTPGRLHFSLTARG
jgi:hypothetical protein